MKKVFSILIATVVSCFALSAQNISVGVSPLGSAYNDLSIESEGYQYDFGKPLSILVGYEFMRGGTFNMWELSYDTGKQTDFRWKGDIPILDEHYFENLKNITIMRYIGGTINKQSRLQIPLGVGLGASYLMGEHNHFLWDFGLKARIKFFVLDNLAVYAGASWRLGIGNTDLNNHNYQVRNSIKYLEAGVSFALPTASVL